MLTSILQSNGAQNTARGEQLIVNQCNGSGPVKGSALSTKFHSFRAPLRGLITEAGKCYYQAHPSTFASSGVS